MKIALAGQTWGAANGPGVFARRLAHRLARRGHDVLSIVPMPRLRLRWSRERDVTLAEIPAIPMLPFYPEVRIPPAPFSSVLRVLEQFEPELIHIQDHYLLSRAALDAARQMLLPVIATNHFIPANILPHVPLGGSPLTARLTERVLWKTLVDVLERTDLVVTPTGTAASILEPRLCAVSIRVISCGVDLDKFRPPSLQERCAARQRWNIADGEIVFTYVGRLDFEKRVDVLIDAIAHARRSNIRLLVAGRGRRLSRLEALASKYRTGQKIVFLGFVKDQALPSLLHASDFFAMPGEAELQSIATLEAMAAGLPVLAGDACALPELVESGVNGELFESGLWTDAAEKIDLLAGAQHRWMAMSKASRARAERHSLDATAKAYEALYEQVVAPPSGPDRRYDTSDLRPAAVESKRVQPALFTLRRKPDDTL